MGFIEIVKAVAGKKFGDVKKSWSQGKREAIDTSLPLQIHLGGCLVLDQTPFVIHGEAITQRPPAAECLVFAYGRMEMGSSVAHRFYLESHADPEEKSVLQIVMGKTIEECRLFASLDEVYPDSTDEWEFWIGEEDGYIGLPAFEDQQGRHYNRVWGEGDGRMAPAEFTETLYLDRFGDNTASVSHAAMLYGRWIDEPTQTAEYVLISREAHTDGTALIQLSTGIDIPSESIIVKY